MRHRLTAEERRAIADEALSRARGSMALTNLPTIYREFMARGIPEADIVPRENVLTFHAWRALGRHVRRGEHGVQVVTYIPVPPSERELEAARRDGKPAPTGHSRPRVAYVFHVSQTDADEPAQMAA